MEGMGRDGVDSEDIEEMEGISGNEAATSSRMDAR
jgi:hypothetical protein